jgi:hypothetical protein
VLQFEAGFDVIHPPMNIMMDYPKRPTPAMLTQRLGYALLSGDTQAIADLYHRYRRIEELWQDPQFVYYAGIAELILGDETRANEILQSLPKDSAYYRSSKDFLARFQGVQTTSSSSHQQQSPTSTTAAP